MKTINLKATFKNKAIFFFLIVIGISFIVILHTIDEGHQGLQGIFKTASLIEKGIFLIGFTLIALFIYSRLKRRIDRVYAFIISVISGIVLAFVFLFGVLFLISWLTYPLSNLN